MLMSIINLPIKVEQNINLGKTPKEIRPNALGTFRRSEHHLIFDF